MNDDKDNQDLVVDKEGSMNQGVNINVTSGDDSTPEPEVNDIQAPPEPVIEEAVVESTDNTANSPKFESTDSDDSSSDSMSSESEPTVAEPPTTEEPTVSDPFAQSASTLNSTTPAASQSMSNNEQSQPKEHKNNKKLALVVTLLIAVLLAGVAIYLFMSAEDNAVEAPTSQTTQQVQEEVSPATAEDIDQAVTEIDETVQSIDDSTDLSEEAVSDTTLGL